MLRPSVISELQHSKPDEDRRRGFANAKIRGVALRPASSRSIHEAMIMSDQLYRDLISPDDPRYQSWLIIRSFIRGEESAARAELLKAFDKNGSLELTDIVRFIERLFDAAAKAIVLTVNSTNSAERRSDDLDELLRRKLGK
jgi:hypothetical protein